MIKNVNVVKYTASDRCINGTHKLAGSGHSQSVPVETGWALRGALGQSSWLYKITAWRVVNILLLALRNLRETIRLILNFAYDLRRFRRYSNLVFTGSGRARAAALIAMASHGIEKGLALPNPRPDYGQKLAKLLLWRLTRYVRVYGHDHTSKAALSTLWAYICFLDRFGNDTSEIRKRLREIQRIDSQFVTISESLGGVNIISKTDYEQSVCRDLEEWFAARRSVRHFADRRVERSVVEKAVRIAQSSPSACNRQSVRIWVLLDRNWIGKILTIQGGARGFDNSIPALLIVTSDLSCWQSVGERYQGWIDGGLFAMTLVWAFHSMGIVTCMLNWSKRKETDQELRNCLNLPANELVVLMIAAGYPPDQFRVAKSARLPLSDILRYVGEPE